MPPPNPHRDRRHHRRSILDRILLLAIVTLLSLPNPVRAGQGTELLLTDGTRSPATLTEFDYNSQAIAWQFENATGEPLQSTTTNQLVRWGNPVKAKRAATLILRDGSTLITDRTWAASGYARADDKSVALNRRDGWAVVERPEAQWLLLEAALEGTHPEELLRSVTNRQSESDLVWLVGGDQIEGAVQSIKNGEAVILLGKEATPNKVPVSRIRAIQFGSVSKAKPRQPACLVGLDDGTLLAASSVRIVKTKAQVHTLAGLSLEVEAESLVFLQPTAANQKSSSGQESPKPPPAPRRIVKYLSEGEADDYRSTPYFDLAWPYARDASLDGTPLQAGGRLYAKGLAMHSASRLVYRLDNQSSERPLRFQAELAVADSDLSVGSVTFRVYALRDGKVEPLYESPIVRGGDSPLPIDMDLSGASALVLVVDYADNGDTGDQALWLDARLIHGS